MIITRRYELDMGHCLPDHEGKCYRPHGHRYVIEATVDGAVVQHGPERGMVADFGSVKVAMGHVLNSFDHRFVMCADDPRVDAALAAFGAGVTTLSTPPTAENLATHWARQLRPMLPELVSLRVYETPNCWADWSCALTAFTTA